MRAASVFVLWDRPGTVPDTWGGPSYGRRQDKRVEEACG
jgi:hypothetical protein